jgi:hypothetical protein
MSELFGEVSSLHIDPDQDFVFCELRGLPSPLCTLFDVTRKAASREPINADHVDQWFPPKNGKPVF